MLLQPRMNMPSPSPATKKKVKKKGNRHVYITERIRYLNFEVPSVDTVVEEDKLTKKLAQAREVRNWKAEAHALLQLGQLMKWKGKLEEGDEYLLQSASILRSHTFEDESGDLMDENA